MAMKPRVWLKAFGTSLLFGAVCLAEIRPASIQERFENLDFGAGEPGSMPSDWHLGPEGTTVYSVQTGDRAACNGGKQCGNIRSVGMAPHKLSFLYQVVDATPYRGKRLTYRADVRASVAGASVAGLIVRIHREDGSTSFRDDMGIHPIVSGPWASYEIDALGPVTK